MTLKNIFTTTAIIVAASITSTAQAQFNVAFSNSMLASVNQLRTSSGLSPLANDDRLAISAQAKAEEMANLDYFSHTSPVYGDFSNFMIQHKVQASAMAENIAMHSNNVSPQTVYEMWYNSPGHLHNMLSPSMNVLGVGVAYRPGRGYYYVQQFSNGGASQNPFTPAKPPAAPAKPPAAPAKPPAAPAKPPVVPAKPPAAPAKHSHHHPHH